MILAIMMDHGIWQPDPEHASHTPPDFDWNKEQYKVKQLDNIVSACNSARVIYIIMFNGGPLTNISCKPRLEPDLWHWAHSEVPEYPAISGKVNMKSNQYIPSSVDFKKHCNFLMLIVSAEY